jgi:type II secretory ATPase GspE/PulE/Tfp pilus assembly ATPase PilB-like protein
MVCGHCKSEFRIDREDLLENFSSSDVSKVFKRKKVISTCKGVGCPECHNTGYKRRTGLFEILKINDKMKSVLEGYSENTKVRNDAITKGMEAMSIDGLMKVKEGMTTVDEVLRVLKV